MKRFVLMAAALGLLSLASQTKADSFVNPPEDFFPGWATPFPYQRNISWDFSQNPVGGPSSNGAPGATYEGTLDPLLKSSDFVAFAGAVQYYPGPNNTVLGQYGNAIGIINNTNGILAGSATFHIDNVIDMEPVKHLWLELTGVATAGDAATITVIPPAGYTTSNVLYMDQQISVNPPLYLQDYGYTIQPNPPGEDIVFNFSVAPGGVDLFTSLHVATESVPEPGSVILLGIGTLGALGCAWRRRK
jgi:PEP-CTERM motif